MRRWGVERDPIAQGRIKGAKPVAVLDIGSNSVRLVVYEHHARSLTPLYNEKSSCALGRGVAATGQLATDSAERAIRAIRRFALVSKQMGVGRTHILATSAVREASNGAEFSRQVAEIMGAEVQVLSGTEEAHFAALGVVAGIPGFSGMVGDLGGGSLELSIVENGQDFDGQTLELGVIRIQDDSDGSPVQAGRIARERLEHTPLIGSQTGRIFCAIGGTWRSIAKLHQRLEKYPLRMVQHYAASAPDIAALCEDVVRSYETDGTYERADSISSSRRHLLPFGAAILGEVLRAGNFDQVIFSALGVREGYLFGQLNPEERDADPLLQVCEETSLLRSRSPAHAPELYAFTSRFFAGTAFTESLDEARLRHAACLLSDIAWRGHPDYRGEQAVDLVAYGALVGIDHPGRAFLAEVLGVRYMGLKQKSVSEALLQLAGEDTNARARLLGALFRVAYPLSAGMPGVLPHISFATEGDVLVLQLARKFEFLDGERLNNRLDQLAQVSGFAQAEVRIG